MPVGLKSRTHTGPQKFLSIKNMLDQALWNSSDLHTPISKKLDITFTLETGKYSAFYGGMDALFALVNLVNGIPMDFCCRCKDDKCGRWFFLTSNHKREFCNQLCAARYTERMKRGRDPEKFREYNRDFYRKWLK